MLFRVYNLFNGVKIPKMKRSRNFEALKSG